MELEVEKDSQKLKDMLLKTDFKDYFLKFTFGAIFRGTLGTF